MRRQQQNGEAVFVCPPLIRQTSSGGATTSTETSSFKSRRQRSSTDQAQRYSVHSSCSSSSLGSGSLECFSPVFRAQSRTGVAYDDVPGWLQEVGLPDYTRLFLDAGYDLPTITRMTPADVTAIGVRQPEERKRVMDEIRRLKPTSHFDPCISAFGRPETVHEWLTLLDLTIYSPLFVQQGYHSIDQVSKFMWEDFEDIGIEKLGHLKKLELAAKSLRSSATPTNNNHLSSNHSSPAPRSRDFLSVSSDGRRLSHAGSDQLSVRSFASSTGTGASTKPLASVKPIHRPVIPPPLVIPPSAPDDLVKEPTPHTPDWTTTSVELPPPQHRRIERHCSMTSSPRKRMVDLSIVRCSPGSPAATMAPMGEVSRQRSTEPSDKQRRAVSAAVLPNPRTPNSAPNPDNIDFDDLPPPPQSLMCEDVISALRDASPRHTAPPMNRMSMPSPGRRSVSSMENGVSQRLLQTNGHHQTGSQHTLTMNGKTPPQPAATNGHNGHTNGNHNVNISPQSAMVLNGQARTNRQKRANITSAGSSHEVFGEIGTMLEDLSNELEDLLTEEDEIMSPVSVTQSHKLHVVTVAKT